jgi:DNA-binding response OmpR family regulator
MARVLVFHEETGPRVFIEGRARVHHHVATAPDLGRAVRSIGSFQPSVIVAHLDTKRTGALDMLRYMKRNRVDVPVVLVGDGGAGILQTMAMKLGAAAFVEYPMEQGAFDQAISKALQADRDAHGQTPPICEEERNGNLSELEKQLNRRMMCFAGRNQVYIQSLIQGNGLPSKPRITLKCPLRKEFGHTPNVYYEYVRDVCCGDPSVCPAWQQFQARNTA